MIGHHVIWSINSCCHRFGHRKHETQERSTNLGALSIISFGESYHNNHHNDPASPRFGMGWREPNIDYWFIVACKKVGLATDRPLIAAVEGPSIAWITTAGGRYTVTSVRVEPPRTLLCHSIAPFSP